MQMFYGLWSIIHGPKNKKPFIHNRDEEFSPRYHPVYRNAKCHFALQSLYCDNGLTRHQLLGFTGEVPLASGRRVRPFDYAFALLVAPLKAIWHSRSVPLKGFHLTLPSR